MKKQIRFGVFETNSSSTHSLTVSSLEEYDKWERGELYFSENWGLGAKFVTYSEVKDYLIDEGYAFDELIEDEHIFDQELRSLNIYTFYTYFESGVRKFGNKYTTPGGERIQIFGRYSED